MVPASKPAKVLIAATPQSRRRLNELLSDHFELFHAATIKQALKSAREVQPHAIICTLTFDDSRMFDFLKAVKDDSLISSIPFITCREASALPKVVAESIETATHYLGSTLYLDLIRLNERGRGNEGALLVKDCLLKPNPSKSWHRSTSLDGVQT